jgi:hypothetical protein
MNFSAKNVNGIEKIVATQSRIFIITAQIKQSTLLFQLKSHLNIKIRIILVKLCNKVGSY